MALIPGTKLGPYEISAPLGAGGMGEVYRAKDTRLSRDVAIKILPKEMCADAARKQRFEREAKTISGLNHPNICVLYDIGCQDGVNYLVMECVEGETLAKRIEKGPLPLEQLLKYGAQIAEALDKAHRAGIVHRDLKPSNIMLTSSGAKLLDFGLAKLVSAPASLATLTMSAPATPAFRACGSSRSPTIVSSSRSWMYGPWGSSHWINVPARRRHVVAVQTVSGPRETQLPRTYAVASAEK